MLKLNMAQQKDIREGFASLNASIEAYNAAVAEVRERLDNLLLEVESKSDDLMNAIQEVVDAQQEYFENKSDSWHESDKAEKYEDWMTETEGLLDFIPEVPDEPSFEEPIDTIELDVLVIQTAPAKD